MTAVSVLTTDAEFIHVIAAGLPTLLDEEALPPIESLEIRPSPYRTSFPLDELHVTLGDGRQVRLIRKLLSLRTLSPNASAAKRAELFDAWREVEVYRRVLADARLGTAAFIGAGVCSDASGPWLVLEHVQGVEMYQVGAMESWCTAAAWLATMHERLAWAATDGALASSLIRQGWDTWSRSMQRALEVGLGTVPARTRARLAAAHDAVITLLEGMPVRLLHGDAYASNIILDDPQTPQRVCAVDWEMASLGPALLDLAALTAGSWSQDAVSHLASAYVGALPVSSSWRHDRTAFETALDACRLQVAVQWLGWRGDWVPPPDHLHDWVAMANTCLDRMGL
jgi:aminoglycoside phosphotransferase (APT) family kinase protein